MSNVRRAVDEPIFYPNWFSPGSLFTDKVLDSALPLNRPVKCSALVIIVPIYLLVNLVAYRGMVIFIKTI